MSYAQKSYPQIQGINGRYTIANIGCFITAFCNLESDFSIQVDPLTLNNFLVNNNGYVDVDDGIYDDVGWDTITKYDRSTRVSHTVDHRKEQSAGWPSTNQSIVRFYYRSQQTGNMIFHFCKVADAASHLIVDSWDGIVKQSPYGEPTAWAEYIHEAPAPPPPKYTVIENYPSGKQVQLNKQPTNLWGMNYDFDYMKNNPVEVHGQGEIVTVTNKVKHINGYEYYRREGQIDGFNILDCNDYVAPTLPSPAPEPVTPPAPYIPPAAPNKGTPAETYTLLTALPYYDAPQTAINAGKVQGIFAPGTYFVHGKEERAWNISTSNMDNQYRWVDTVNNKAPVIVPVTVTPKPVQQPMADNTWKTTRSWFYPDRAKYDLYELQEDTVVKDLDNRGKDWYVNAVEGNDTSDNTILRVHGTVYKDGVKYYLLHPPKDVNWEYWYVIPVTNKHTGKAYLLKWPDTFSTTPKKNQVTAGDEVVAAMLKLGYRIMDIVSPRKIREWLNNK